MREEHLAGGVGVGAVGVVEDGGCPEGRDEEDGPETDEEPEDAGAPGGGRGAAMAWEMVAGSREAGKGMGLNTSPPPDLGAWWML